MKTCFASKRIAAFLLAICMTLSMLPMAVSAEENPPDVSQEPAELEMLFEMETEGAPSSGADLLDLDPTGGGIGPLDIGIDDVCAIGETGYASLTDALEYVADGETIVLLTTIIHNDPVTIADMNITFDTEKGSLTIETASNTGPALTVTNGSVTVQGSGYLDVKGKAGGVRANKATVTVRYATSSAGTGAYAENGGVITVLGDAKGYALGAYAFGTGSTIMVEDDAISTGGFTNAVEAVAGGHVQAKNAIAEGVNSYGVAVTGPNATVVITRNATGMQGGVWAQGSGSTITVGGDVTANGGGGIGAWANTGAKITIDGIITAENYVKVGTSTKTAADKTMPTSLIGYDTYTDATSTIWLKETAPATDVCQIGAVGYPSLSLALAAVMSGQTIELLQDIEHTTQITIDSKTVSFDLNGKKLNVITNDTYGLRVQNGGKVYLSDSGTGTGEFNVTGQYGGLGVYGTVDAVSEASVTNATGVHCGVDASRGVATVYGDVTATGHSNDDEWGVKAAQESSVTVHGDAVGHDFGVSTDRSTVTVYGDASGGTGANSTGVKAEYENTVTVKGDAKGGRQGVSVGAKCMVVIEGSAICTGNSFGTVYGVFLNTGTGPSSTLTVHGDVTADGDNAYGAVAKSSWTGAVAQITIDGSIQAAKYIMVGDTEKAFGSGIDSLSKAGYKEYADTRNTIWVKDTTADVCQIGSTGYSSLGLALAAVKDGETIKLLQNITHTSPVLIDSTNITIDLSDGSLTIDTWDNIDHYALTVKDCTVTTIGDGFLDVKGYYRGVSADSGTVTVRRAESRGNGVYAENGGTITVLEIAKGYSAGAYAQDAGSKIIVKDAEISNGMNGAAVWAHNGAIIEAESALAQGVGSIGAAANNATIEISRDASGAFRGVRAANASIIAVSGNVRAGMDGGIGAEALSGGQITIDGTVTAESYVKVGVFTKTAGETTPTTKPGYSTYHDSLTSSTVWVKDTASPTPLDTPTGLVWDTATAGTVKAKWVAVAGAQRYAVRLYKSGVYQGLLETNATNLHLTSYLRSFGTGTYTFTVKALAPSGSVDYTDSLAATSAPYVYTAPICQIGSTGYATLGAAITDALNSGGATTITLLQNINEAAPITVDSADITFALDSFDLTIDTSAAPGSTALTVQNGGKVSCSGSGKLNVEGSQRGVRAVAGSEIHISGSVTAGQYGISTSGGSGNPRITVDGNVTATGQGVGASGEVEAVSAGGNATVVIGGNVTANRTVETQVVTGIYSNGSTVTVGRNVTTQGSGLNVQNDGHVTIDGMLNFNPTGSGSQSYIKLGFPAAIKTADDFELISSRPGYKEYKNGANIVWVKGSEQLGKPTGLAWDTSAGELKATWSAVPNADQYKVEYYKDGTKLGMSTIVSSPSASTEDIKGNLLVSGAGSYTFTVQATAAAGSGYIDSDVSSQSGSYSNTPVGTNYIVTVSGSHAGITGAGNYTQGTTVTIHAGSRSGYSFAGWTSSDVTITNAINKDASFVMPGKAVTVTANWSYNSGGGSGGGYTPEPPKDTLTLDKQPNMPTVVKISVSGMAKNSVLSSTITEQMAEGAIKTAQDAAKKSGKAADGIAVDFNVTGSGNNASLNITIDAGAIDRLKEAGVKFIKIGSAVLDVTLDTAAIAELDKQSTGTVTVSAKMQTKLSKAAKALIGSRPVWDITVHYQKNGKTKYISSFGRGTVTLGIAYKAASKEKTGSLCGVYVDKDGKPQLLTNSSYAGGRLLFGRNSLSTYGVGYNPLAPAFTDTMKHWAKDHIDFAASRNLISGISATTFAPNTAITCADFLMALGRLSGADVSSYKVSSFTDVKATDPAMPYIEWAVKAKIMQGIGGGKFGPALSISRQDMAVIMQNYAKATGCKLPVSVAAVTFSDITKIAAYAKEAAKALQQTGIMQGKENNTFDPQGNTTRAEASAILRRFVELVIDEGTAREWMQNDAGQWKYIDENGMPVTGWLVTENGKYHYYFGKDGIMTAGKWLQIDGKWYYFYADGLLAKNIKVDGYEVDENGIRKTK